MLIYIFMKKTLLISLRKIYLAVTLHQYSLFSIRCGFLSHFAYICSKRKGCSKQDKNVQSRAFRAIFSNILKYFTGTFCNKKKETFQSIRDNHSHRVLLQLQNQISGIKFSRFSVATIGGNPGMVGDHKDVHYHMLSLEGLFKKGYYIRTC